MDSSSGVTVLFVEDDPDDARFVERLLTDYRSGLGDGDDHPVSVETVAHAGTLAESLDRVDSTGTDVVLLDLGLPDSTGVETVERMVERAPTVPVVVLTGRSDAGIDAIRSGAQDYLLKGHITAPLLLRSLRYAIERARVTRELRDRTHRLAVANEILRTDLRNDVSLIVGLGDQLEDLVGPDDRRVVESLLEASQHVLDLTDTVADLMDVLSAEPDSRCGPTDLRAVLEPELDRVRADAGVDLAVEWRVPEDEVPTVVGTPMLGPALRRLLSNATPPTSPDTTRLSVTVDATRDRVSVSVADDGGGTPDAQKAAIRDPGSGTGDRMTMGAGIYFVATVVERAGGDIRISDNSPRGTVVTLELDRAGRHGT